MSVQEPHKVIRGFQIVKQLRLICYSELRTRRYRVWEFKGKGDDSQEDEKSKCLINVFQATH